MVRHKTSSSKVGFSSPFIEERLYFYNLVYDIIEENTVLVPFYRGAVVFLDGLDIDYANVKFVLVPFYRGAVVFSIVCTI